MRPGVTRTDTEERGAPGLGAEGLVSVGAESQFGTTGSSGGDGGGAYLSMWMSSKPLNWTLKSSKDGKCMSGVKLKNLT